MTRALAMISGGLDSILAAKLIKDQGIDVIGICFKSYFFNEENANRMVKQIDVPLKVVDFSDKHLEMLKNPKHGYGKNMNPCIDCHAMMMSYCGELLKELDADFVITGEVLNQRPMSQNIKALGIVKEESGIGEKILRPLCAKNLPPTKMELDGLVDRENLLCISGRTRKIQMELAKEWGIKEYPSPAGGCKLTEPNYARRLKDLFNHNENATEEEIELLSYGRHFRIGENTKVISTRTLIEAEACKEFLRETDMVFLAQDYNGSMIILTGEPTEEAINFAAKVTVRYSKGKDEENVKVSYGYYKKPFIGSVITSSGSEEELEKYIIK